MRLTSEIWTGAVVNFTIEVTDETLKSNEQPYRLCRAFMIHASAERTPRQQENFVSSHPKYPNEVVRKTTYSMFSKFDGNLESGLRGRRRSFWTDRRCHRTMLE